MAIKNILFNNIKFYCSNEVHLNPSNIFNNDNFFKIWHYNSKKKMVFKIKKEFDLELGIKIGCWECISHRKDAYGYSGFKLKGKMIKTHRFMYCVFNFIDNIDGIKGKIIRHKCDNRLCSNPNHLEIGNHEDNMKDMIDRNRSNKGEKNYFSKLTENDILYIRNSSIGLSYLSEMYGVTKNTIRRIKKRQIWEHVEDIDSNLLDEDIVI